MTKPSMEPWLRGSIGGVDHLVAPTLFAFVQAREDLDYYTTGFSIEQMWSKPFGLGSVGFHIRHIGRSVDRLTTYLEGLALSQAQMAELGSEHEPGVSREELLGEMERHLRRAEEVIRTLDAERLAEPRTVGRLRLPTTVIGLAIHIAEHTQRHVGQAIVTAKVVAAAT